jgi:dihydrofolate synthase/folylpolyglutamate synthase
LDFEQAEAFLNATQMHGVKPSLDRITRLCRKLGDPQKSFPALHVTGTNGKTSTARMMASILRESGRRVALYTSPHLQCVTERMVVDGRPMRREDFASTMAGLAPLVRQVDEETGDPLSYFEVSTALAFAYFAARRVDVAVVEVGMGGRWDATNLVDAKVAVVTNVAMDHVEELGPKLADIAREKAGIIKPGCVAVGGALAPEALEVVQEACLEKGVPLKLLGRDFEVLYQVTLGVQTERVGQMLGIRGLFRQYADLYLPLLGDHQAVNAACAVAALEAYAGKPRYLSAVEVERGLAAASSPGRLEVASLNPLVLLDGAHNLDGALKLARVLVNDLDYERMVLVLGILEDKDWRSMLEVLVPLADTVIVTRSRNERAASMDKLAAEARRLGREVLQVEGVAEAVKRARTLAAVSDLVCVTGSLYTVGEAREALRLPAE